MPEREAALRQLRLAPGHHLALLAQARESYPEECCGILVGRRVGEVGEVPGVEVVEVVATANSSPGDRRRGYRIAPEVLLATQKAARERGLEMVGFYHSHPDGGPRPSRRDRAGAWPGVSYLIVAPGEDGGWELASWCLAAGGTAFVAERVAVAEPVAGGAARGQPEDPGERG